MNSDKLKDQLINSQKVNMVINDLTELLEILRDSEIDIKLMSEKLMQYPAISAKLLAVANSAWVSPRVPITNVHQACVMLGQSLASSISIAIVVGSPFDHYRCKLFDPSHYWISAFLTADASRQLILNINDLGTDTLNNSMTIGLLHNLGLLALADLAPLQTSEALQLAKNQQSSINQSLIEKLGFGYIEAGTILLKSWGIPDLIIDAIGMEPHYLEKHGVDLVKVLKSGKDLAQSIIKYEFSEKKEKSPFNNSFERELFDLLKGTFEDTLKLSKQLN